MYKGIIFDLDQTLIDTSIAESQRKLRNWSVVYSLVPKFKIYEGINDVFVSLRKNGLRTCIVTTGQRKYAQTVVNHFNIPCEFIVDYSSTSRIKPFPDPMLKALEIFKLKNIEVISFGDRAIDILSSNAAGIKSVACLWGSNEKDILLQAKPTIIAKNPTDIINLIKL
jgi:phosphoglycolate phosphatase-like HAD superfamily hydrolase